MQALAERYRPRTLDQVCGQPKAVALCAGLLKHGVGGRAIWISGPSGCGKTTLGRILAASLADRLHTVEVDGGEVSVDWLRAAEHESAFWPLTGSGRAYIVNEAHGLSTVAIRKLLVLLERIPNHAVWIFTTTRAGEADLFEAKIDAGPFASRCLPVALTAQGVRQPFAKRLREVAIAEGLDGDTPEAYERIVKDANSNLREALQVIEARLLARAGAAA